MRWSVAEDVVHPVAVYRYGHAAVVALCVVAGSLATVCCSIVLRAKYGCPFIHDFGTPSFSEEAVRQENRGAQLARYPLQQGRYL